MYDPNPLLTLGKRKRRSSQGIHESAEMAHSISEVTQCFSVLRHQSADEAETIPKTTTVVTNEKDAHR